VIEPLADARVATGVVEYSWRTRTEATLGPSYASLLGHLMARYPESGQVFLSDLLGPAPPELGPPEIETVCRILIEMPDLGTWHQSALRILPRYRATAERLLMQDRQGDDQEKSYRAQIWLAELRGETPGVANQRSMARGRGTTDPPTLARRRAVTPAPDDRAGPLFDPPSGGPPSITNAAPARPLPAAGAVSTPPAADPPPVRPPNSVPVAAAAPAYSGPKSGTLECSGGPVPQNAEYVFRNLPPANLQLDYDKRVWEARLKPGENQSQRLILKNISSGPQKRCVVRWSILPQ